MSDPTHDVESPAKKNSICAIGVATSPKGPVKIGRTTLDVEQRLAAIRTESSNLIVPEGLDRSTLSVLFSVEAEPWVEFELHRHFHRYHLCGEWFALNPAVVGREIKMAISEMSRTRGRATSGRVEPSVRIPRSHRRVVRHAEVESDHHVASTPTASLSSPTRQYELFKGWVSAGFTEDQALRMISMLVASNA
jgi:hypothetical protein